MRIPDATALLHTWELGTDKPPILRALLLMTTVLPEQDRSALGHWNIGRRDRLLLDLRNVLFGPDVRCLTDCTHCGEPIELDFRIDDIRVAHGETGQPYYLEAGDYAVQYRLPDSEDLLTLEGEAPAQAERRLLARCVMDARKQSGRVEVAALPDAVLSAVSKSMAEADPQAEVLLEVSCPVCSAVSPALFDIVAHLWTELDAWARRMLREVHALAAVYGWSEAEILRMSAVRRRAYLDLVGG